MEAARTTRGLKTDETDGSYTHVMGNVGIVFLVVFQLPSLEIHFWRRDP